MICTKFSVHRSGQSTVKRGWFSGLYQNSDDIWRTGYMDLPLGEYQLKFVAGDQMKVAVDDVMLLNGMCANICKYGCYSYYYGIFAIKRNLCR